MGATVKIVSTNRRGYKIIDDFRFDPDTMTLFDEPLSREGIARMDKGDVVDLIEAHGGKADKRKGVDTLRAELIAIMFLDD